jgi:hypothetical protein
VTRELLHAKHAVAAAWLFVLVAALGGAPAFAGEVPTAFTARGESRITVDADGKVHTVTRTFHLIRPANPDGFGTVSIVVDESVDTVAESGIEGYASRWVRTKLVDLGQVSRRQERKLEAEGAGTKIEGHPYTVIDPGCCDALNGGRVFSLYTGKELFPVSGDLDKVTAHLTVLSSPRHVRHLAVHSPGAADDHRVYGSEGQMKSRKPVVVTWASWKEPIMRMLIIPPPRPVVAPGALMTEPPFRVERVEWEQPDDARWPRTKMMGYEAQDHAVDAKTITGIAVLLYFSGGAVARVPIQADRIDVDHVKVPPGMKARIEDR